MSKVKISWQARKYQTFCPVIVMVGARGITFLSERSYTQYTSSCDTMRTALLYFALCDELNCTLENKSPHLWGMFHGYVLRGETMQLKFITNCVLLLWENWFFITNSWVWRLGIEKKKLNTVLIINIVTALFIKKKPITECTSQVVGSFIAS